MSSADEGSHAAEAYSRVGRTREVYARASVRRAYVVYHVPKSAAYAEITHQRRTADF